MVKCQNKDKKTNNYCEGKAKSGVIIDKIKVCEICFYWIKKKTLDRNERQVLLRKYIGSGLNFEEALTKVNNFHNYLKDQQKRLSAAGRKDKDIEVKFREEFYALCQKLER